MPSEIQFKLEISFLGLDRSGSEPFNYYYFIIIDTFSKAVVYVLEVISSLAMPPLLFLQLVLLSKVKKVSQIVA